MWHSIVAVAVGSALGALLRWFFSMKLNGLFPAIPLGTVSANLIGGYCIGLAIAYFSQAVNIAPEWRLLIVTGFCGGLTTFSTFSVELLSLLQQGRMALGFMMLAIHVSGSLIMTFVGMISWQWFEFR